jgi:hypothetical protein
MTTSTLGKALRAASLAEARRAKEDAVSSAARKAGGRVVKDQNNVNGRFITIEVSPEVSTRKAAQAVRAAVRGQFGRVSQASVSGNEYRFQGMERFPSMTGRGVIHKSSEFGEITYFTIRPSG